jgi:hypothetical protein
MRAGLRRGLRPHYVLLLVLALSDYPVCASPPGSQPAAASAAAQCLPIPQIARHCMRDWALNFRGKMETAWQSAAATCYPAWQSMATTCFPSPIAAASEGSKGSGGANTTNQGEKYELEFVAEAASKGLKLPDVGDEFVQLVVVRHGMSIWNKDNRFTAWMDVPLSQGGLSDARRAAALCSAAGIRFDVAFTSVLQRAVKTCNMILEEIGQLWVPTVCDWRLNERHDGVLTGLNKKIAVVQYGKENVSTWRRSYSVAPPALERSHPYAARPCASLSPHSSSCASVAGALDPGSLREQVLARPRPKVQETAC